MSRLNPFPCSPSNRPSWVWLFLAAGILAGLPSQRVWSQDFSPPLDDEGNLVQFERDIAPILRARCLECHGPDDAKNDFRVDRPDDLLIFIEPGDWEISDLFTEYLTTDDEEMLMPPVAQGGPLSAAELALIRIWIEEGASWPDDFELVTPAGTTVDAPVPAEAKVPPKSLMARIYAFQGYLHPATIHFPIALLSVGALFVVLGLKWPAIGTQVPLACLLLGAASAIVATVMGWSFATQQGYAGWTRIDFDSEIFWHRWSGVVVTVLSTLLAIIAIVAVRGNRVGLTRVWKVGLLVVAGMVGLVGHQGGELTYGHDFYPKAFRILFGETDAEGVDNVAVLEDELEDEPTEDDS